MKRLISSYLDDELDRLREEDLLYHFSVCKNCITELERQRATQSYLIDALNPGEVGDIWSAIEDKIFESEKKHDRKLLPLLTPIFKPAVSYGTAALFGIFIGVFSGAMSAGLFGSDSYATSTLAGLKSTDEPSSFEYLDKTPPNSLTAIYFGSNTEEMDD